MERIMTKVLLVPEQKDQKRIPSFSWLLTFGSVLGVTRCRKQQMKNQAECLAGARLYNTIVAIVIILVDCFGLIKKLELLNFETSTLLQQVQVGSNIIHVLCAIIIRLSLWHAGFKLSAYIEHWEDDILNVQCCDYIKKKVKKYLLISVVLSISFSSFLFYPLFGFISFFFPIFNVPLFSSSLLPCVTYDIDTAFATIYTAGYCALAVSTAEKIVDNMSMKFKSDQALKYIKVKDTCDGLYGKSKEIKCIQEVLSGLVAAVNQGNSILGCLWMTMSFHAMATFCIILYLLIFDPAIIDPGYLLSLISRGLVDAVLLTQLTFFGQLLKDKKQEILEHLRGMYSCLDTLDEKLAFLSTQSYVGSATLELDAAGFFALGRSFLLSVIGTALTFFIVLVQFKNGEY